MVERYSRIAIALHWTIAAAILFQIAIGRELDALGRRGFELFQLHKSIGIAILLLSLIRLAVRAIKPRPPPTERGATGLLAAAVHAGFYVVMIAAPLTGWLLVSTAKVKVPTLLFGIVPLPHLPAPAAMRGLANWGHEALAWVAIGLLALHLAGAVRHHLLIRDGLLWRMSPGRSWLVLLPLIALVPGGFLLGRALLPAAMTPAPAVTVVPPAAPEPLVEAKMATPVPVPTAATSASPVADEPTPRWTIAPGGRLAFSVGGSDGPLSGSFGRWSGTIDMDPDRPENADIRIAIDLSSATIGDAYQDGMLKGADFFDVEAHPTARFRSFDVTRSAPGRYRARGTLSLKGKSAPQTIDFTLTGSGDRRAVAGSGSIRRASFGVGTGEAGDGIDALVTLSFAFDARSGR